MNALLEHILATIVSPCDDKPDHDHTYGMTRICIRHEKEVSACHGSDSVVLSLMLKVIRGRGSTFEYLRYRDVVERCIDCCGVPTLLLLFPSLWRTYCSNAKRASTGHPVVSSRVVFPSCPSGVLPVCNVQIVWRLLHVQGWRFFQFWCGWHPYASFCGSLSLCCAVKRGMSFVLLHYQ